MAHRSKIFVSYSHRDRDWLERLQVHLAPLARTGAIELWDDTRILSGDDWRREITQALSETRAAILLVSADFLASDFVVRSELPSLLGAAATEGVRILPVIVSASLFEETPQLARFQAVNPPSRPLIAMDRADQEALLEQVARTVLRLVTPVPDAAESNSEPSIVARVESTGPAADSPDWAPPTTATGGLADRARVVRELTTALAPERYTYLALIAVAALVVLFSFGRLLFGEPVTGTQQTTLLSSFFGAGGAALFLSGRLVRLNDRTMDFIREQPRSAGEAA